MLKADLHVHSEYSMDSKTTLDQIIKTCLKKNINCIALSDHGTVEGALKLQKIAPFKVIVAEEVLTTRGEIMGMFMKETVPSGMSMEESIRGIKEQGALLCAQHPFDKFRPDALKAEVVEEIADQIDIMEIFNARNPMVTSNKLAQKYAQEHNLPGTAGSDAHAAFEIGNAYIEMPEFETKEEFVAALRQGKVYGHRTTIFSRTASIWAKICNHQPLFKKSTGRANG